MFPSRRIGLQVCRQDHAKCDAFTMVSILAVVLHDLKVIELASKPLVGGH